MASAVSVLMGSCSGTTYPQLNLLII